MVGKNVNILLVEDDEVDQQAVKRAFDKFGISNPLIIAEDGKEALEILRGGKGHVIKRPFIVLLDLNMPRMGGHTFLQELRNDPDLKNTVVFVLTTSKDAGDMAKAYSMNVAGYIVKGDLNLSASQTVPFLRDYWNTVKIPV